jgi:hypothetical protein
MFSKQEQQIASVMKREKTLQILHEKLQAACFDVDDRQIVQAKIMQLQELRNQLEVVLAKNREIYKTQVQGVEKQLIQREQALTEVDKVFIDFPDLLEFFANKQKQLQESLALVTSQLQES